MRRYAIVSHHKDNELKIENDKILGIIPVHDLVQNYHWFRLDDEHVFMLAEYSVGNHHALHNHDKVSMMPHTGSVKPVHQHMHDKIKHQHRDKHWLALQNHFGLDATHTIEEVIDLAAAKHSSLFAIHS